MDWRTLFLYFLKHWYKMKTFQDLHRSIRTFQDIDLKPMTFYVLIFHFPKTRTSNSPHNPFKLANHYVMKILVFSKQKSVIKLGLWCRNHWNPLGPCQTHSMWGPGPIEAKNFQNRCKEFIRKLSFNGFFFLFVIKIWTIFSSFPQLQWLVL